MGECDRKPRLVLGGKQIYTVTGHNVPMLPNRKVIEKLYICVNKLILIDTSVSSTNGILSLPISQIIFAYRAFLFFILEYC